MGNSHIIAELIPGPSCKASPLAPNAVCGRIDIMIADTREIAAGSEVDIIDLPGFTERYVCRHNHPLSRKKKLKIGDIFNYPIATPWLPEAVLKKLSELAGLPINDISELSHGTIECHYYKVLIETVKACDAIGLGLEPIFQDEVSRGNLVYLMISTPQIKSHFGIVTKAGYSLVPAVEVFQKYLIPAAQELSLRAIENTKR